MPLFLLLLIQEWYNTRSRYKRYKKDVFSNIDTAHSVVAQCCPTKKFNEGIKTVKKRF